MTRHGGAILTMIAAIACASAPASTHAQSTIDPVNKRAWGEGAGWTNWRDADGGAMGARLVGATLMGFIWSEHAGWINLGTLGASVTVAPDGALIGSAWSERGGWVVFGTSPAVGADGARLEGGRLHGFAWSERLGWINLNAVQIGTFVALACPPDLTGDGLVSGADISFILSAWGGGGRADLNADGVVDSGDISFVLSAWGPC